MSTSSKQLVKDAAFNNMIIQDTLTVQKRLSASNAVFASATVDELIVNNLVTSTFTDVTDWLRSIKFKSKFRKWRFCCFWKYHFNRRKYSSDHW